MVIDENFLLSKIMDLNTSIAAICGKIDGFLQSQSAQQAEINGLKDRVSSTGADVVTIKDTVSTVRNRILGRRQSVLRLWGILATARSRLMPTAISPCGACTLPPVTSISSCRDRG